MWTLSRSQAVVGGTASSGLLVSLLRIATKAALPGDRAGLGRSTTLYFAAAAALCALCYVLCWRVVPALPLVRVHRAQHKASPKPTGLSALGCGTLYPV